MRSIIFVIVYFASGNYVITDLLGVNNIIKNLALGLLICLLALLSNKKEVKIDKTVPVVIAGIMPSLFLNPFAVSLYVLFGLVIILIVYPFTRKEFIKILRYICAVNTLLVLLVYFQALILYYDSDLIKFAYPVVESDFNDNGEIQHWVQRLGVLTKERIEILGKSLPRFSGFMTEPSAFVFSGIMPVIFLDDLFPKKISRIWLFVPYLLLSRSTFLFGLIVGYLIVRLVRFRNVYKAHLVLISLVSLFIGFLPLIYSQISKFLTLSTFFFLSNKMHSFEARLGSIFTVLNSTTLFGVEHIELNGMPLALFWLGKFGFFGFFALLIYFINVLRVNPSKIVLLIIVYAMFLLSKGWNTLLYFLILSAYARFSIGIKHT